MRGQNRAQSLMDENWRAQFAGQGKMRTGAPFPCDRHQCEIRMCSNIQIASKMR